MARDLLLEPAFPTSDIQGDILAGLPKRHEHLVFFRITDPAKFRAFLKTLDLTSMQECLDKRAAIKARKDKGDETVLPTPGLNVAFTFKGLTALNVPGIDHAPGMDAFRAGMAQRQAILADTPAATWKVLAPGTLVHGVFILTGASHAEVVDVISLRLAPPAANGWAKVYEQVGEVRPDPARGHEHFGYADGVSQPGVRGRVGTDPLTPTVPGGADNQGSLGQDLLWPGEFVFGYPGQNPAGPTLEVKGDVKAPPVPFMQNGAFLVFRRLSQQVPEFNASVKQASAGLGATVDPASPDLMGAQLVGRWKSGAPLILTPTQDDPALADGGPEVNHFEFGGDREGLKCPWGAHVRKAYPRDDVRHNTTPTEEEITASEAFTQTHRMMRRGIAFGPELTEDEAMAGVSAGGTQARGLLFKCYVTSIENQFEFVQQQWVDAADFSQPGSGIDAIMGQSASASRPFLGAAPVSHDASKKPHLSLKGFVHMEGGEYFFAPSIPSVKAA